MLSQKNEPRKRVTQAEIAAKAGVSRNTVSRVFNHPELVNEVLREKISNVASELGYFDTIEKPIAIGVVVPFLFHITHADLLHHLTRVAREYDKSVLIVQSSGSRQSERVAIESLLQRDIAGLILISPRSSEAEIERLSRNGNAIVSVNKTILNFSSVSFGSVVTANEEGSYKATQYLIEEGHQRIVFLAGRLASESSDQRREGFLRAVREMPTSVEWVIKEIEARRPTFRAGYEMMQELLGAKTVFDGVLAYNDQMGLGAIWALQQAGYLVPKDISVVGCDGINAGRFSYPPLTTVAVGLDRMATEIFQILSMEIEAKQHRKHLIERRHRQVVPELIKRESVISRRKST